MIESFDVSGVKHVRMANFYWCFLLYMQRAFLICIFRQIDSHYLVLTRARTRLRCWFIHSHLRKAFRLFLTYFFLIFRPFELECLVLEFPLISHPIFDESVELAFRIVGSRQAGIDIGLFDVFEGRCSISEKRSIFIIISEVVGLGPCHPLRDIFAVLSKWLTGYVELIKYFLRCIATSELYLGSVFPRLVLKKLLFRARVPMLWRELYILLILLIIKAFYVIGDPTSSD